MIPSDLRDHVKVLAQVGVLEGRDRVFSFPDTPACPPAQALNLALRGCLY